MLRAVCCLVAVACVASPVFAQKAVTSAKPQAGVAVFRAGAATSNVTPPLGELIIGGWKPIPATNIHDELHARSLVLDDGNTRIAIVLCDNVGIPRDVFDEARKLVAAETGLPPENLLLASTHTHSATTARSASKVIAATEFTNYQKFVIRRIADSVRLAMNKLEPAEIGFGSASEPSQVFNRRWHMLSEAETHLTNPFGGVDKVRMNPPRRHAALVQPAGPVDPEIAFLSVQSVDGRPIALLANYSLHYVGGVKSGDVSADYFGMFANRIAELLDAEKQTPAFVGMMSNGTSGDVNNINFRGKSERYERYEKMRQVAYLVADKVFAAHREITFQREVTLAAELKDLELAVRQPTAEQLEWLKKVSQLSEDAETKHRRERIYAERIGRILKAPKTVAVPLQTLRIGDVGIAAIPFEVFAEIGLEIKEKSPLPHTFTIELANGSFGYLPTPRQHKLGGYETWLGTNFVEKEASDKITHQLLEMFERVK